MALRDIVSYLITAEDKTKAATDTAKSNLNGLRTSYEGVQTSLRSLSRLSLGFISVAGVKAGTTAIIDTRVELERMRNTLAQGVGAQNLAAELLFVRKTADDFGQSLGDVSAAYGRFAAATRGTSLEGSATRDIFLGISTAATTLGLSADQLGGALTAVQQIVSKGKVSAEELRGQLGERLPGAFQIAARAMGVTTSELDKMLQAGELLSEDFLPKFAQQLRTEFAGGLEAASQSAGAAVNRLSTAWTELKQGLSQSPVGDAAIAGINLLTRAIAQLNDEAAARDFGLKPGLFSFSAETLAVARALRTDPGSLGEMRLRRDGGSDETLTEDARFSQAELSRLTERQNRIRAARVEIAKIRKELRSPSERLGDQIADIREKGQAGELSTTEVNDLIAKARAQSSLGKAAEGIDKASLKSNVDAIRSELDRLVGAYANANSLLEAQRQANLIGDEDYFETKKGYIRLQADIQANALEAENKALREYKATGKERIDLDRQIAENVAAIAKLRADASTAEQIVGIQQTAAAQKIARDWNEARAAAQAYIDTLNRGYQRDLEAIGQGNAERQRQSGRSQIEDRFSQQRQQLESERRSGAFDQRPEEYDKQLGLIREFQSKALADWDRYYGDLKSKQQDSALGFNEAIANYVDEAQNNFSQIESLTTNTFRSIEDAFVSFAKTGKLSFKGLADSIIADLSRILVKKALLNVILGLAGNTGFGTGSNFGNQDYGAFLATGTNYVPYDGFKATLHRGEAVVPAAFNPAAGGAGGGVVINQTNHFSGGDGGGVDQRRLAQMVGEIAVAKITESQRRNGFRS